MAVVSVERKGNYAILALKREPVNSLNTEVWQQLKGAFDDLEADDSIDGVIFTSGLVRNVFTAGNDLNELYAPRTSLEQYRRFWVLSNHFLAQVYSSRLATVSAIRGACPAGGCGLSLCCDVRVMTTTGQIGLNEVALGIPVPVYWGRLMARLIGDGAAERLCQAATLASPQEALELGLVDKLVSTEELLPVAEAQLTQLLKHPRFGREQTKQQFRAAFAQEWKDFAESEPETAWQMLTHPPIIKALESYMGKLGSKRSKL